MQHNGVLVLQKNSMNKGSKDEGAKDRTDQGPMQGNDSLVVLENSYSEGSVDGRGDVHRLRTALLAMNIL